MAWQDNYDQVEDRLAKFWKDNPNGRVYTEHLDIRDDHTGIIIKAYVYADKEDINPVGSQKFKVARYPGDIDIMEPIINCCSLEDIVVDVDKSIRKIANKIKNTPKVYLGDFKAGLDNR